MHITRYFDLDPNRVADLVLLTKADLLSTLAFDLERVREEIARLNTNVPILPFSAHTGQGMDEWLTWLRARREEGLAQAAKFVTEPLT